MQTACGDDLSLAEHLTVTGILNNLLAPDTIVLLDEVALVNYLVVQESCITGIDDLHLAHHLTNNNLEVLVVDFYTLHTIDVLCLIDDIILYSRRSLDRKDVLRSDSSVRQRYTGAYVVAFLYENLL